MYIIKYMWPLFTKKSAKNMGVPLALATAAPSGAMGIGQAAAGQAAAQGTNAIMGLILGGINDRRQVRQQRRLNEVSKEMQQWQMEQQLKMWEATGYGAQKRQMQEAGINPALMYGMSGGGAQTASVNTSSPAAAPGGGGEAMGMMGMGLNLALLKAQKDNIEADTAKKQAEATATAGVKTAEGQQNIEESKARQEMLLQGVDNARQQHTLMELEATLKNMENYEKQASQEDRLDFIRYQTRQANRQLQIVTNEAYISTKTLGEKVKIVQEAAIGAVLGNAMQRENIQGAPVERAAKQQGIKESIQRIMQNWDKMEQGNKELLIKDILKSYNTDPTPEFTKEAIDAIGDAMRIGVK